MSMIPPTWSGSFARIAPGEDLPGQDKAGLGGRDPGEPLRWKRALEQAQQEALASMFRPMPSFPLHPETPMGSNGHAALHGSLNRSLQYSKAGTPFSAQADPVPSAGVQARESASRPDSSSRPALYSGNSGLVPAHVSTTHLPTSSPGVSPDGNPPPALDRSLTQVFARQLPQGAATVKLVDALVQTLAGATSTAVGGVLPSLAPGAVLGSGYAQTTVLPILPQSHIQTAGSPIGVSVASSSMIIEGPLPAGRELSSIGTMARTASKGGVSTDPSPVRLHAEWSAEGIRLWIGASATQPLNLLPLAQHLRQWLTRHGERLAAVVLNGHTIWHDVEDDSSSFRFGDPFAAPLDEVPDPSILPLPILSTEPA